MVEKWQLSDLVRPLWEHTQPQPACCCASYPRSLPQETVFVKHFQEQMKYTQGRPLSVLNTLPLDTPYTHLSMHCPQQTGTNFSLDDGNRKFLTHVLLLCLDKTTNQAAQIPCQQAGTHSCQQAGTHSCHKRVTAHVVTDSLSIVVVPGPYTTRKDQPPPDCGFSCGEWVGRPLHVDMSALRKHHMFFPPPGPQQCLS